MKNTYNWVVRIAPPLQKSAEKRMDNDLEELGHLVPCHPGPLLVSIVCTDAVDQSLKGNVRCQCGKEVATVAGARNGADLDYQLVPD